jgi:nucleoside-diphosphate-sugar epimerase
LVGRALVAELRARGEAAVTYDLKDGFDLRFDLPVIEDPQVYCWFLAWDVGGVKYITDDSQQLGILRSNLALCDRVFGWLRATCLPFTFVSTQMVGYPNAYGLTKQVGEYWCSLCSGGLIARLWNCYDAEEVSIRSHLIPDLILQGIRNRRISLMTSGAERRQFLHAVDCAKGLVAQRDCQQPIADLTSGEWITVRSVAECVARQLDCPLELGDNPGYESMIEPINKLPGWHPAIDLSDGIRRVIEMMKASGWC